MKYPAYSALLTDLYELTMLHGYFKERMTGRAAFELFLHTRPAPRNFLIAAGLEQALDYLENFAFTEAECRWLAETQRFDEDFIGELRRLRFTGDVYALPEGTLFFEKEPIIRIEAPLPEAQIVETRLINLLQLQSMVASKAVRSRIAAPDKLLVDFGLRRAHGAEAGLFAARACYLAGIDGTSNVEAARVFGIPMYGTMAHSYIMAHADETQAFLNFANAQPDNIVLLIDTYDTEQAARRVVTVADQLRTRGLSVRAVRLDSGDIADHARKVRAILDAGNHPEIGIFASSGLDEYELDRLQQVAAPINGYGIGTKMLVSADAPYLDCAYKLQEYAGIPRYKHSEGKITLPGRHQVYRQTTTDGLLDHDLIGLMDQLHAGEPLLVKVMERGKRIDGRESLDEIRSRVLAQLQRLPKHFLSLHTSAASPVRIAPEVKALMTPDVAARLNGTRD
ncbi:MAG: nicotinate phosphoribosyltransferase [Gammaproteobacteria bacterium RIFCSPLOWO2_12_FULL_52_10]|nr:MAG: nicotinate phosphoribosyltransferase [Gammaproteobacteria bacterium RIFCSPLOWO2_12_FULL_52_10]